MSRMIFVNLPVADLPSSMAFYEAIGFTNNPQFTDETGACMVLSEAIYVMLLTHDKWASFTNKPIPAPEMSEVMLAISCENREAVNQMADTAGAHGGGDINPLQDHGFMVSRSFEDPDGHVWEPFWLDIAAAEQAKQSAEAI